MQMSGSPLLRQIKRPFVSRTTLLSARIHGLAITVAPYAELTLEALLLTLAVTYQGWLLAIMLAGEALKQTCTAAAAAAASKAAIGSEVFVLVGLQSLSKYLPDAEADNVDSWKATLYRRLNSVRLFDRPIPLLLGQDIEAFEQDQMEALYQEARASDSSLTEWRVPSSDESSAVVALPPAGSAEHEDSECSPTSPTAHWAAQAGGAAMENEHKEDGTDEERVSSAVGGPASPTAHWAQSSGAAEQTAGDGGAPDGEHTWRDPLLDPSDWHNLDDAVDDDCNLVEDRGDHEDDDDDSWWQPEDIAAIPDTGTSNVQRAAGHIRDDPYTLQ